MATTYMILNPIPTEPDPCWTDVVEGFATIRKNIAGTACVVKWQGSKPASLPANTEYDHAGILAYLVTNAVDWTPEL